MSWQPLILRYDSLPSTNDEALSQAQRGAAEGLCIVARTQTAGRGRQQRAWLSPPDAGLYLSLVLRPRLLAPHWPLVTFAVSLAVQDSLRQTCALFADLKWPNDVHAHGRKICGILAETCDTPTSRACIVGVGVNLRARAWPTELRESATSVEEATGQPPDADVFLTNLLRAASVHYAALHQPDGPASIIKTWASRSSYATGCRVRVTFGPETFDGTTRGLAPDGALRVEMVDGLIKTVRAGEITGLRMVAR